MEPSEPRLDTQFENIRRNLDEIASDVSEINQETRRNTRILLGALVVVALVFAGLMANGLGWL
ncbi:hypothetical protein [Pseudomonas turukhanskensis]|uniref:Uncharacterized protein n=1 Tax=Pseudomonas turukhanskensis TaxID=1806536 RepID=A0A9W6K4S6_9PSED|nr:hypothetical protein [Pseudomonas turukhanskensis]GLK89505.1 hypothetical protein GCM10017655_25670 [Pseudomonas turukhanskensis]